MEIHLEDVQGEEREGYFVQPLMKRRWAVQTDILHEIDAICRRHQIHYYGWFGTLLGAVRHHGFIPWDDDIDLAMLRKDHEKFQFYFDKEAPDGWKMLKEEPTLVSIVNTDMIRLDQQFLDRYHGCPYIVGVDIFCVDNVPKSKADEELWLDLFQVVNDLHVHWDLFEEDERWREEKWAQLNEIERLTRWHIDRGSSIKEQLCFLADKIAAMYWDTECDEMTLISRLCAKSHYRIPRDCFDRILGLPFEDTMIPVLEDFDLVCRLEYGNDYMTPIQTYIHETGIKNQMKILQDYFKEQGRDLPECFMMTF